MKRFPGIKKNKLIVEKDKHFIFIPDSEYITTNCRMVVVFPDAVWENYFLHIDSEFIYKNFPEATYDIMCRGVKLYIGRTTRCKKEEFEKEKGEKIAYSKCQKTALKLAAFYADILEKKFSQEAKRLKYLRKYFKSSALREEEYLNTYR